MPPHLELIVHQENVGRAVLRPVRGRSPSVAVVYATPAGDVELHDDGRPLTWSGHLTTRYRTRYEVDISRHQRTLRLESSPPPARGDAHFFDTLITVEFAVTDPVRIVRANVRDGMPPVANYINDTCRSISRRFDIEDSAGAEAAIQDFFARPRELSAGITIFACTARLLPDLAARRFIEERRDAVRAGERRLIEDENRLHEQWMRNQVAAEEQAGELRREEARRRAMSERPLGIEELMRMELARNPGATGDMLEKALQAVRERQEHELLLRREEHELLQRQAARENERLALLAGNDLLRAGHVQDLLPGAPTPPRVTATASDLWDEPLPGLTGGPVARPASPPPPPAYSPPPPGPAAGPPEPMAGRVLDPVPSSDPSSVQVPVYLVVDRSVGSGPYMDQINQGITTTLTSLAVAEGDLGRVVQLSVVSYSDSVDVPLAMQPVRPDTVVPALSSSGQVHYAAAFRQLLTTIPDDMTVLKSASGQVMRPMVFFLTGAPPADESLWLDVRTQLVDPTVQPYAPQIFAGGVGTARASAIAGIATLPEYAFLSTDADPGQAVRRYFSYVAQQIQDCARAMVAGRPSTEYRRPEGFRMVNELI
jgi:uncharacterized protein YegL